MNVAHIKAMPHSATPMGGLTMVASWGTLDCGVCSYQIV